MEHQYIMNTYARFPLVLESGSGMYVTDENGKKYLDFVAGIAVNALGHANEKIVKAISEQAVKLIHSSNLYYTKPQMLLSKKLVENSGFKKAFFCNSGAEAVEASMKLARKYGNSKGRYEIIAMRQSFHGRTFGAVTATGQPKYQESFKPLLPGVIHVPFNDIDALSAAVTNETCAILLEPVQGEGGIIPAEKDYLKNVRKLCDELDILLIFDEVQCGVGRLGTFFAYEHFGVCPDIAVLAKGLAGGVPIGAVLAVEKAADTFVPGDHASTFGGNPLATSVALVVVDEVMAILPSVKETGRYLTEKLNELKNKHKGIKAVRGIGLMQCIELNIPVSAIISKCMEKGLLLVSSGINVIRFVPPLIVKKENVDEMLEILDDVLLNILTKEELI